MSYMEDFQKVLMEIILFVQDLTAVEQEKFDAATHNNILVIEECIKKEQALLLRSKGLEQKREQLLKAMGAEKMTLRQLMDSVSAMEKSQLTPICQQLDTHLAEYQKVYKKTKTVIEANLHRIDAGLESLTGKPLENTVAYSDHGEKITNKKGFTSRRV